MRRAAIAVLALAVVSSTAGAWPTGGWDNGGGSSGTSATPAPTWTPAPTQTPVLYNTPGKIAVHSTPGANLQPYAGSTPCSGYVTTIDGFGQTTCATPIPTQAIPTQVPTPAVPALPLSSTNGGTGANLSAAGSGRYPKADGAGAFAASTLAAAGIGSCTNQVVTGNNADAVPSCSAVADAYLTGLIQAAHGGAGGLTGLVDGNNTSAPSAYGGTGAVAGKVISVLDAHGAATFVDAGSTNITNVTGGVFVVPNKSTTGTTVNRLVKLDTSASPATAVIATTSDTTNILGVCVSGCGTTGSATILSVGLAPCDYDGTATVGDYVVASTTTNGKCHDSGSTSTYPTGVAVLGKVDTSGDTSAARATAFNTPDVASASAGPNGKGITLQTNGTTSAATANLNATTPAASGNGTNVTWQASTSGNTTSVSAQVDPTGFVNLAYSGTLKIAGTGVAAVSSTGNVASTTRIEDCTSGSSADVTRTLPAATGSGRIIDIGKVDAGTKNCVIGRTGSDTLNGATTRTLSAQWKADTCRDYASGSWFCRGDGT